MSLFPYLGALACLLPAVVFAKPIAYQGGTAIMGEYGAGTMQEVQAFYAPSYRWSAGIGLLHLEADDHRFSRDIAYLRGNLLLRRWNLPRAQANVFAWGGIGTASGSDFEGPKTGWNAGGQADYETLRFYSSLRTDWQYAQNAYSHRIDTVQLGWAPYAHDWDRLATWFVLQGRTYTGGIYEGVEPAALIRLFKNGRRGAVWVEAGVTREGRLQSMFMFNF
ncbi:MAG: hypothetical protein EPN60_06970 [Nevskiaceae bacterium]|jgi:hypothetical protein|nr:MAG: hypothetical protein EPO48_15155 [Nevskiaceae bacterium]TAM28739.1 MAG: hypothetical protein EPN60_06970 [Nevskiaceae bacterium]